MTVFRIGGDGLGQLGSNFSTQFRCGCLGVCNDQKIIEICRADREQLKLLKAYLQRILGKMVDEIASGNVEPNPYTRGSSPSACTFCPYGAVCHEAEVEGRRNYKTMTAQRFWDEIGKEMGSNG